MSMIIIISITAIGSAAQQTTTGTIIKIAPDFSMCRVSYLLMTNRNVAKS